MQLWVVPVYRAALTGGDVVCRIKVGGLDVSRRPSLFPHIVYLEFRAQRIAVVLHQPEVVAAAKHLYLGQIEGVLPSVWDTKTALVLDDRAVSSWSVSML